MSGSIALSPPAKPAPSPRSRWPQRLPSSHAPKPSTPAPTAVREGAAMPDDSFSAYRAMMMGGILPPDKPPKPAEPLVVTPFEDITPSLDTADFVQGVLVEGSAAVIYGESNAGKTFWATDL